MNTAPMDERAAIDSWPVPRQRRRRLALWGALVALLAVAQSLLVFLTANYERVRAQDVEGVVVFSTSGLTSTKLWDAIAAFFAK